MKILLVTPINRTYIIMPSLGLGYIAALADKAGHAVKILNCVKENMSYRDFANFIRLNHFDLIGFQVFSYDLDSVKKHLSSIKANSPDTITVAGGAHPSGDPEGIMSYLPELDYAFQGEAEVGFPLFLERLASKIDDYSDIPGLIYSKEGQICINPIKLVEDLDSLPMPAWDIIIPESYPEAPHGAFAKNFPTAPIIVTRGCPYPCTFCSGKTITGLKVRRRSIDNVLEELKYLSRRGIREFHIEDENFILDKSMVIDFCNRLLSDRLNMSWSLPAGVRIDSLDREILEAMERSGCYSIALGIEFGSQRIMDLTKKMITIDMVQQKLELFKGLNIKTTGFFMFGIPGETINEIKETIRFALRLPIDRAQFNNFMPLPGSKIYRDLLEKGRLKKINWGKFYVHDVSYTDGAITPRILKNLQRTAYLRFYLRPKIIWNILKEIKSLRHLKFLFKRLWDSLS